MNKSELIINKLLRVVESNIKEIEELNLKDNSKIEKDKLVFETRLLLNKTIKMVEELSNEKVDNQNEIIISFVSRINLLNEKLYYYEEESEMNLTANKKYK